MNPLTATFAAGCFWGIEENFRRIPGVIESTSGYTGGETENATYEAVCSGKTGHAEAVQVIFDPEKVSYGDLLDAFWAMHDPTQLNRQGWDVGSQYRSAIFCHSEDQREAAEKSRAAEEASGRFPGKIVTEISPAATFWPAEEYHQRYLEKRGKGACH